MSTLTEDQLATITLDVLQEYARVTDKLALCSDILGLRIDNPKVEEYENKVIEKCTLWNVVIDWKGN